MKQIFLNAIFISLIAMGLSWAITWLFIFEAVGNIPTQALFLSLLFPLVISFPTGLMFEHQKKKLEDANKSLQTAHHRLSMAHSAVQHKSQRDGLTGLFNRDHFFEITSKLQQRGISGTLLMIDADNFKRINDTYGHVAGDEALRIISNAIADSVRPDDFVGRVGGEEFAVYVRDASTIDSIVVAERIRTSVEEAKFKPTMLQTHKLSVSIGGADLAPDADIVDGMKEADERLYVAKRSGRNQCIMGEYGVEVSQAA